LNAHPDSGSAQPTLRPSLLMIAYTNYKIDPRVIRAAEAAASGGYAVDVLALTRHGDPPEEHVNGVHLIHLNHRRYRGANVAWYVLSYLRFFFKCFWKATLLQLSRRYVCVHVHNMPDFLVFCALIPKLCGARVFLDIHDPMPDTFSSKFGAGGRSWLYRMLLAEERISAAFADKIITVHEPLKEHVLVSLHGLRAEDIEVVSNFADDRLFQPGAYPAPDQLRLVFHGTILERYGLGHAMRAIAEMRHKDKLRVLIIGEGDFSEELKSLIVSLRLTDIVEFDNRVYPLPELPPRLRHYNLGLVPLELSAITRFALPLKLLEYLALGIPSVTVRNVAIGHYLCDEDCFFYDPHDPATLTALLDHLAEQPQALHQRHERALLLRDRFLWSPERDRYLRLLQTTLRGGKPHAVSAEP
jgi:glycosyltransferase involved in cell wall biosynthesis